MEEKEILRKLGELVKRKCKITWVDEDTEKRIREIVENAVVTLRHKLGMRDAPLETFLDPGATKTLYENYCMYDWNDMLEEFDGNYKKEILAVRHRYEVEYAKKEAEQLQ